MLETVLCVVKEGGIKKLLSCFRIWAFKSDCVFVYSSSTRSNIYYYLVCVFVSKTNPSPNVWSFFPLNRPT